MTTTDHSINKQQLLQQQAQLQARLLQLRGGELSRAEASADHFNYAEDSDAQVNMAKDIELALDAHESAELQSITNALDRMARGDYGFCTDCGKAIAAARLEAFPEAARCIACQTLAEMN